MLPSASVCISLWRRRHISWVPSVVSSRIEAVCLWNLPGHPLRILFPWPSLFLLFRLTSKMTSLCKMPITITIWWWARQISPCSISRWRATRLRLADTWCHGSSAVHPCGRASASWAIISGVNTFLPKWCNWFTIFWESLAKGWIVKIIYHYSSLQAILAKNLPISQKKLCL